MERLPGFRDFYPEPLPRQDEWSADARQYIFKNWRAVCHRYGFREYDGPPLEPLELFTTKSGQEIVGQLYNFKDKGERNVSLRPEITPSLARMIAAHERSYKKPIKWFSIPQLFRYERQQKGRLREHFQFNCDILGEKETAADAELIALLIDALRDFGLTEKDFVIRLSSRNAWHDFFVTHQGKPDNEYAFYQIVDKLEREEASVSEQQLSALGFSMLEVRAMIEEGKPTTELEVILGNLESRGLREFVKVDYGVIRGLAYYTGVVFEAFDRQGELRAIAGGGRYDNLVELISGGKVKMPALGFGMGDVVLLEVLKARNLLPKFCARLDAFVLIEVEALRLESLKLIQELRSAGLAVDYLLTQSKSDKQFKRAQELNAALTLKIERHTDGALFVTVKKLSDRTETTLSRLEVLENIRANCVMSPA